MITKVCFPKKIAVIQECGIIEYSLYITSYSLYIKDLNRTYFKIERQSHFTRVTDGEPMNLYENLIKTRQNLK